MFGSLIIKIIKGNIKRSLIHTAKSKMLETELGKKKNKKVNKKQDYGEKPFL